MLKKYILILAFSVIVFSLNGQNLPVFKSGDRVCFVGNSITQAGDFHHNISLFYATRFPEREITIFNAGISGDVTQGVINRLDQDVFIHDPHYVIIMIGMNDISRNLYAKDLKNPENDFRKQQALQTYKSNLDSIIRIILSKNIKIVLQKPSIYDQTAVLERFNNYGANDALKICADYMGELAQKYKIPFVDYWTIMSDINKQIQRTDSSATVIGPDRVHPSAPGHFVMSYQFLKSSLSSSLVSKLVIARNKKQTVKASINCDIGKFSRERKVIAINYRENSLPYPIREDQLKALNWVSFTRDLNQQLLIVKNLKPGNYELKIDEQSIATFSHHDFKNGLNLAVYNTPQMKHAHQVRAIFSEIWKQEANQRTIKHVEFMHLRNFGFKADLDKTKTYLDALYHDKYAGESYGAYLKTQFDKYITLKPSETVFSQQIINLRKQVYQLNKPVIHHIQIIKQ